MIQIFFKKVVIKRHLSKMSVINKLFNARKTYNKIKITNYLKLQAKKYRMNKE